FHAGPEVTLEQDLLRRDLTVNAIAEDRKGKRIDPFNGVADVHERTFRHVSPAFSEDPVRLLRLARFATRFTDFSIAEQTLALCRQLVASGEVDALVAERVWREMARALQYDRPSRFFRILLQIGALARLLPEVDDLFGVPQRPEFHPEIDVGEHTLQVLDQCARLNGGLETRYACLLHDLGKALTPESDWPAHRGHELLGLPAVRAVSDRLKVPKVCRELALLVCEHHLKVQRAQELRPATVVDLIQRLDGWRRTDRFEQVLLACLADQMGRQPLDQLATGQNQPVPMLPAIEFLRRARNETERVSSEALVAQGMTGIALADAIRRQRIDRVRSIRQSP
ncbi:MAG: HD domain-containing protein, partial [Pseudomonadota bacterium]